jgi:peptidoglycan/LPS O-acetylase OafA/YrhL
MKKNILTKYLAVFLLLCIVLDGILLCFFADKPWWNKWMITGPNLFMILGAFYCHLMTKNVDENPTKLTWLLVYKGIKLVLTVAILVLYIVLVKENSQAFIIVTAAAYLIALAAETFVYNHYFKHLNKEDKA